MNLPCSFLEVDPSDCMDWSTRKDFKHDASVVEAIHVSNDLAERDVALMSEYNILLTSDEEQKQYLLIAVAEHRKIFPESNKQIIGMNIFYVQALSLVFSARILQITLDHAMTR